MKTRQLEINVPVVAETVRQVLPTGLARTILLTCTLQREECPAIGGEKAQERDPILTSQAAVTENLVCRLRSTGRDGPYHPMVEHSIQQRGMVVVLAVQVLTDNLDMCLLAHLLGGLHSETDVASAVGTNRGKVYQSPWI